MTEEALEHRKNRLRAEARKLPKSPGVYLMKNNEGKVIYVGKAKALANRVSSYFLNLNSREKRTLKLVSNIYSFEVILVETEVDALILERSLIKTYYPKYNVLLKDGKEYPFLRIDMNHPWPRLEKVRKRKKDGAIYLGPFGNVRYLNQVMSLAHKIFPLVRCSEHEFKNAKRPCNYYHFGQCLAPCTLEVDRAVYKQTMDDVISFIGGNNKEVIEKLQKKMEDASNRLSYELAAQYRDQLKALKNLIGKQSIIYRDLSECDAVSISHSEGICSVHIINVRGFMITNRDNFILEVPYEDDPEIMLFEFILQYYDQRYIPEKILTNIPIAEKGILAQAIAGPGNLVPSITSGYTKEENEVIAISSKNSLFALKESKRKPIQNESISLDLIKDEIGYDGSLERIECIDISNLGGTAIVASCVCFSHGKPDKNNYRLYNITDSSENGADDFGSIRQVVSRRLKRAIEEDNFPDLLIIDGGKGQLSVALDEAKTFPDIPTKIVSLAKAKTKSHDQDLTVRTYERVYLNEINQPIPLKIGSSSFRLFTQIRDEAHRFAITHHRKRRSKILNTSLLEQIPGIGPALRKSLFDIFGSLEAISSASIESLCQVRGISEEKAVLIKSFFEEHKSNPQK